MAVIIKPKQSNVSGLVPTTSNLAYGEMAVNTTDRKIWVNDNGTIVEIANNASAAGGGFITEGDAVAFAIALG